MILSSPTSYFYLTRKRKGLTVTLLLQEYDRETSKAENQVNNFACRVITRAMSKGNINPQNPQG